ncbi:MAG: IMP dehydrogenase, partial [Candidatus Brocadiia bacterium]|nr:IMP dehydrogenase [Candidatus Brocadiia bacterium]
MEPTSGVSAAELFRKGEGITYDDLILLPGYISFSLDEVDLETRLTREITLRRPIVSSPMDTVTESAMAIHMALLGGVGMIHYNNSIEEQIAQVRRTKKFENGFITDPIVLGPEHRIRDVEDISRQHGFFGVPITEDGTLKGKLIGIVARRDIDFETDLDRPLREVMTSELVTAPVGITLAEGNAILKASKKGKLPI